MLNNRPFVANPDRKFPCAKNREFSAREQGSYKRKTGTEQMASRDSWAGEGSRRQLPVAPGLQVLLVTQFRHEHQEGVAVSLPKHLLYLWPKADRPICGFGRKQTSASAT